LNDHVERETRDCEKGRRISVANKSRKKYQGRISQQRAIQRKKRRMYYWFSIIGAVVLIASFAAYRFFNPPSPPEVVLPINFSEPVDADGTAWGPSNAPVLVEVFSDFQCPFCARFAEEAGYQLQLEYSSSGLVRFEYKHFAFLGPESNLAAEGSECAAEQDRFWEFHDTLFVNFRGQNQGSFRNPALKAMAVTIGLDESSFTSCMDSNKYRTKVNQDTNEGRQRGVNSTPTIFVNGEAVTGAIPYTQLRSLVEGALNR
jgi:protein-disulfide isomerase